MCDVVMLIYSGTFNKIMQVSMTIKSRAASGGLEVRAPAC